MTLGPFPQRQTAQPPIVSRLAAVAKNRDSFPGALIGSGVMNHFAAILADVPGAILERMLIARRAMMIRRFFCVTPILPGTPN
jgi:hypothetical protein